MELEKKSLHMNRQKCKSVMQITLDNDINVPDIKPDIGKIIREQGEINIRDAKAANNRAVIKGELQFHILYVDAEDEYKISHMEGLIDINEVVNLSNSCNSDSIWVKSELEDISSSVINSRKVSVRAIVKLTIMAEEITDEEAAVAVIDGEDAEQFVESGVVTELAMCKKDIFRINEDVVLPAGRDSIKEVLFYDTDLCNIETRMLQNSFGIRGEVRLFILYQGAFNDRVNSYETIIPFSGEIDCMGCDENMISQVDISITERDIEVKADEDGEDRIFNLEIVLGLDMRVYSEEDIQLLTDVYSTKEKIVPEYKDTYFNNLIMKNNSKAKISEKIKLPEDEPGILQLCNAGANIRIDEETKVVGGIETEGVLEISLLYFTGEDKSVMASYKEAVPFEHFIEVNDLNENCIYEINAWVDRISVMVSDEREVEVKAVIALDTIVFDVIEKRIITDFSIGETDEEDIRNKPGMIGYIVQKGDSLWSIAKRFATTVDSVMRLNELETDVIYPGQKLLIMKYIPEV